MTARTFRELGGEIKKTRKVGACALRITTEFMKRKLAWLGVILSVLYLLTLGIIPDPLPFIDEGLALAVLLKSSSYLGYDLRKWLPFLPKKKTYPATRSRRNTDPVTVDV